MSTQHKTVLFEEALESLNVKKGEVYIDATLNGGGHAQGILDKGGKVFGVDIDPEAIKFSAKKFDLELKRQNGLYVARSTFLTIVQGNFAKIRELSSVFGVLGTSGVLFDLGLSSLQLDNAQRGFSFNKEGPLDMRMDPGLNITAADLINSLNERELYELFTEFGQERYSRYIVRHLLEARIKEKITTTRKLAEIIERCIRKKGKIHPATKVFQALRIVVNDELNNLKIGLNEAASLLKKQGRLVVISFHSLEDRVVKKFLMERSELKIITKKPIIPSRREVLDNPRSRSAKMRVAERQ